MVKREEATLSSVSPHSHSVIPSTIMAGLSSLVSGYGSDSDEDQDQQVNPSSGGTSSRLALPPPSSASSKLGLPPPNNTTTTSSNLTAIKKRKDRGKLQIGVQSLSSIEKSTSDDEEQPPNFSSSSTSIPSGKPSHSLFGLLPPPKRPKIDPQEESLKNQGAIKIKELEEDGHAAGLDRDGDGPPKKKVKGNNDFRAMLGLKSNGKEKEKEKKKVDKKEEVEKVPKDDASSVQSQVSKKVESAAPQRDEKPPENSDFFSLGESQVKKFPPFPLFMEEKVGLL